jgi:hypothetical protein
MLRLVFGTAQQVNARRLALLYVFDSYQDLRGAVWGHDRREDSQEYQEGQDNHTHHSGALPEEAPEGQAPQAVRPIVADVSDAGIA